jgi:hypothetical protein
MADWGYLCNNDDISRLVISADDEGCLRVEQYLHDGREITSRFRYMEDLAELVDHPAFTGQVDFAPGDEGLRASLDTHRRLLRGDLH